jgi:hypothetical protein
LICSFNFEIWKEIHLMRHKLSFSLLLIGLSIFMLSLGRATSGEAGAAAASSATVSPDTLAQEWAEVRAKYPHLAVNYLKMREALSEGVAFARVTNAKAFRASAFRQLLASLCQLPEERRPRFCTLLDEREDVRPGARCPNCAGACGTGQTPVDCSDCLQKKGDAGCL